MPIISSEIIENSPQANGSRSITERHTASTGKTYDVHYFAPAGMDADKALSDRVAKMDRMLKDQEIDTYLYRIEEGQDILNETYTETDQAYRAVKFFEWVQDKITHKDFAALKYTPVIVDQFTESQLDALLGSGEGAKVKAWTVKIKEMNTATEGVGV